MQKFTNPLDNINIASPCSADWNEMFGNDRKRFCGDCKLNVYNLSDMTRGEAEQFLSESEGRVCVRFFRRGDGTVLTKNCPVGLQAVKQRVSRAITAVFSMFAGLFAGIFAFNLLPSRGQVTMGDISSNPISVNSARSIPPPTTGKPTMGNVAIPVNRNQKSEVEWEGKISNLGDVKGAIAIEKPRTKSM